MRGNMVVRAGLAGWLLLAAGCGAKDLYAPPVAPVKVRARLALPSEAQGVSMLGSYAFVADGEAGLLSVDLSNPSQPVMVQMVNTTKYAAAVRTASTSLAGRIYDIAFVAENTEGITTYDITDPRNVTSFNQGSTAVDANGLFVDLPQDPTQPYLVYLAESWKGLRIFESDPATPGLLDYNGVFCGTRGYANEVTVKDGFAYVADDEMGVAVVDVRNRMPGMIGVVSACDTQGKARAIELYQNHLYVADDADGLVVMELRVQGTPPVPVPSIVGHVALPGHARGIVVRDGRAFLASQDGGVQVVDVNQPSAPVSMGSVVASYCTGIAASSSGLVVASDRDEGLIVLEADSPFTDLSPPAAVTDLAAVTRDSTTIRLSWHAPGDDGLAGCASRYDLRYALAPITTDAAWDAATQAQGEPAPAVAGTSQTMDVTGLTPGTTYCFALRTADAQPNWSPRSNCVSAATAAGNVTPTLRDELVSPPWGTADSAFVFEVTYEDADGDAPTVAALYLGAVRHDMTMTGGDYRQGARYHLAMQLPVGVYDHHFAFADAGHPTVVTATVAGPWVGNIYMEGSPSDEPGRDTDETLHPVLIPGHVTLGAHEVTQAEYQAIMGTNPSHFAGADLPVENVSWFDAVAYCNARSAAEGLTAAYQVSGSTVTWDREANGYRLPTEAEWEAACRAGTTTAFYGGALTEEACGAEPVLDPLGWYCGNAGGATHAVGQKSPNALGLYDMSGNVWEWCWNWYQADLGSGMGVDPEGPAQGSQRVIRGGSWYYFARDCRSAARAPYWPNSKDDVLGFRVARNAP